ncbi:MAG: hypothetical protein HGB11_14470 [Chlorobiales bacterium]|nr:hypothetical protein [Chlorobiales bacterium]
MDQYFPAYRNDMKAVLCRVRGVRWVEARNKATFPSFDGRRVGTCYKEFMNQVRENVGSFDALNDLPIWRDMTDDEIIEEIRNSPADCRKAFDRLLRRYWSAARAYISDILPSDEWRTYWRDRFQESTELKAQEVPVFNGNIEDEAFSFCKFLDEDADVNIRVLMERMLMIQQIQERLNEPVGSTARSVAEVVAEAPLPEYLTKWKNAHGDKTGAGDFWSDLVTKKEFRDEIENMKNDGLKKSKVLKCYWEKYRSVFNGKSERSFGKRFDADAKCKKLFLE